MQLWHVLLTISIGLGLLSQQIHPIGMIPIILLPIAVYYSQIRTKNIIVKIAAFLLVIILSMGLAAHLLPGFYNLKVIDQVYLSKDAIPFTMYLNFDKALVGIFILGIHHQLISNIKEMVACFKQSIVPMIMTILIVVALAILLNFVRFEPKLPNSLFIWFITNLLLVSTAEEAFFRGFIQRNLSLMMNKIMYGNYFAILCGAILFGLVHYAGGVKYMLLATVAGIGYGWIYDRTKRIESSILTHFSLNLTHFMFFTYPMLVSAL